jgi:hypothetical protein
VRGDRDQPDLQGWPQAHRGAQAGAAADLAGDQPAGRRVVLGSRWSELRPRVPSRFTLAGAPTTLLPRSYQPRRRRWGLTPERGTHD